MRLSPLIHSSPPLGCSSPIPVPFLSSITSKSLTPLDSLQVKYFPSFLLLSLLPHFPALPPSKGCEIWQATARTQHSRNLLYPQQRPGADLPSWASFSSVQDTVCDGWRSPHVHMECLSVHSHFIPCHSVWRNCPWSFCRTACARTAYGHVPAIATWRQIQRNLKAIRLYFKSILSTLF